MMFKRSHFHPKPCGKGRIESSAGTNYNHGQSYLLSSSLISMWRVLALVMSARLMSDHSKQVKPQLFRTY